jgi:dimethylargininase
MTHALDFGPLLLQTPAGRLRTVILVRPSPSIETARPLIGEPGIVYSRALEQHEILRTTLEYFGVETVVLNTHSDDPYEVAAANAAVALRDGVVLMRPTSLSRRGEADRMMAELARIDVPLAAHIAAPGLLDGNDVMLAGDVAFVGLDARGNDLGRSGFSEVARARGYRVVEVKLADGVPSLRAVASPVADDTIVLGGDKADPAAFAGFRTIVLERGEENAAGVLCLGERRVLADVRYRTSFSIMRRAGLRVEAIDLYEFAKAGMTPAMLALALKRD